MINTKYGKYTINISFVLLLKVSFTLIPIKSGKAVLPVVHYIWSDEDYEYRVVLDKQTVEVKKQPRKNEIPESIPAKNWKGNPDLEKAMNIILTAA